MQRFTFCSSLLDLLVFLFQDSHNFFHSLAEVDRRQILLFHESFFHPVAEEGLQWIVDAVGIDNEDRRLVAGDAVGPVMAEGIRQFFQGAHAAGESNEGVTGFDHLCLPGNHIRHFDELRNAPVGLFLCDEDFRNDAGHLSTGCQGGVSGKSHKPHGAAPVDHMKSILPKEFTQPPGQGSIFRIVPIVGAAVYDNIFIARGPAPYSYININAFSCILS